MVLLMVYLPGSVTPTFIGDIPSKSYLSYEIITSSISAKYISVPDFCSLLTYLYWILNSLGIRNCVIPKYLYLCPLLKSWLASSSCSCFSPWTWSRTGCRWPRVQQEAPSQARYRPRSLLSLVYLSPPPPSSGWSPEWSGTRGSSLCITASRQASSVRQPTLLPGIVTLQCCSCIAVQCSAGTTVHCSAAEKTMFGTNPLNIRKPVLGLWRMYDWLL